MKQFKLEEVGPSITEILGKENKLLFKQIFKKKR
jgi:hypothetical protein